MRASGRALRAIARVLGVGSVLLLLLATRVLVSSRAELDRGDLLVSRDPRAALAHYRRAAQWHAPRNPYCQRALRRLMEIASDGRRKGDHELALAAYRSVRGAILSTRSVYTPHEEVLVNTERDIAELTAEGAPAAMDAQRDEDQRRSEALSLLRRDRNPDLRFALLGLAGYVVSVIAAFAFAARAIDEEDRIVDRAARWWGTTWIVAFGVFVLALSQA